jgi:hypothetical protein
MEETLAHARDQQLALTQAFEAACAALSIGPGSLDVWRKERLANILEGLSRADDWDWPSLTQKAIAALVSETAASQAVRKPALQVTGLQSCPDA